MHYYNLQDSLALLNESIERPNAPHLALISTTVLDMSLLTKNVVYMNALENIISNKTQVFRLGFISLVKTSQPMPYIDNAPQSLRVKSNQSILVYVYA